MSITFKVQLKCEKGLCDASVEAEVDLSFDNRNLPRMDVEYPDGWYGGDNVSGFGSVPEFMVLCPNHPPRHRR